MESVGQKLRQGRLRLGLTLEAVSSSTRISLKSLSAIEEDQLDQISSPFLYKSFVRQIGHVVGLDPELLEQDLLSAAGSMPQPRVPGQGGAPLPAATKRQRTHFSRWVFPIGSLGLMLVACSALYAFWERARTETPAQIIASAASLLRISSTADTTDKHRSTANTAQAHTERRPALPPPEAAPQPPDNGVFHIQLSAIEQTWLSVVTDGREVYKGILHPAETKNLEGHELARIRTGNAGGVEVVFNGRNLGPLGSRGQVRTVLFNRNGYEVVEPQTARLISAHVILASYHLLY